MNTKAGFLHTSLIRCGLIALAFVVGAFSVAMTPTNRASAACQTPSEDYGTASIDFSVETAGSYRAWSRIKAPDTTNNSYMLEVDGDQCFVVGDSSDLPAGEWQWADYQDGNAETKIDVELSAGNHTVKLIGREPEVMLDKVLFAADKSCVPTNFGNNCSASPDTAAPIVEITAPSEGDDVTGVVNIEANAAENEDGSTVTKVEFYVNDELISTDSEAPYAASWDSGEAEFGQYHIAAKAYDEAGNTSRDEIAVRLQDATPDTEAPTPPANISAEAEAYNRVKVTWDKSTDDTGVAGYRLYRDGSQIANIKSEGDGEPAAQYVDSDVTASNSYTYRVAAYDSIGNQSGTSGSADVTTPAPSSDDTAAPSAPENLKAEAVNQTQINLTWNASVDDIGVKEYDVYRSSDSSEAEKIATTQETSYGDTNLTSETAYSYYIVAKDSAGNQSEQSATVSATTKLGGDNGDGGNEESSNVPAFCSIIWINFLCGEESNGEPGEIVGSVGDISDVEIRIFINGRQQTYRTDSDGSYKIPNVPAGKYPVIFTHPGFFLNAAWISVGQDQVVTKNITLYSSNIESLVNSFWNRM